MTGVLDSQTANVREKIAHYEQIIAQQPHHAEAHHNLAVLLAKQGHYPQALKHYRDAIHAAPDFTQAHYNLGLLLLQNQQLAAALIQFQNVLALNPDHIEAHFYQGVLNLEKNNLVIAEQAFKKVLHYQPEHLMALNNLGVIALKNKQGQLAVECFTKVLTLDNDHQEARSNLAATFISHDRFENALTHYQILLKARPDNIEYLYNAGVALMALGQLEQAQTYLTQVLSQNTTHTDSLHNLAVIAMRRNQKERAIPFLRQILSLNPDDAINQHLLNALEGQQHAATTPDYAANLFNNYALHYDQHLQTHLNYQIPQHLAKLCDKLQLTSLNITLDLGCGTGLCGAVLRPRTKTLIGVDIAAKMIEQAKNKRIYNELIEAEIETFLSSAQNEQQYDLITCVDTLPYFGELTNLFAALNQCLTSSAYFIFTTEISEVMPWQLQTSARFSHHKHYLQELCLQNSWLMQHCEPVTARLQDGRPLCVYLTAIQKSNTKL